MFFGNIFFSACISLNKTEKPRSPIDLASEHALKKILIVILCSLIPTYLFSMNPVDAEGAPIAKVIYLKKTYCEKRMDQFFIRLKALGFDTHDRRLWATEQGLPPHWRMESLGMPSTGTKQFFDLRFFDEHNVLRVEYKECDHNWMPTRIAASIYY